METTKKKRLEAKEDVTISAKKIRANKECNKGGGVTADDAEVDEFFAILKRMQAGFHYLRNKGVENRVKKPGSGSSLGSWNPAFELEDFGQVDDGGRKFSEGESLVRDKVVVGFDLNVNPTTE
ncbi:protein NEGATIVE REGULATOR OF RESISTANCE [Artemisia annua]|uniref:Protein NEGATIVE REGULATOR OF RESISTANCE n=1 Tax=Artemisia annua TaxID=35608 RepID=A0A2U1PBX2_ARTAN|nr:protein NEGATIVE REGULATOR OF RESISTANCE [Artemisia annua]